MNAKKRLLIFALFVAFCLGIANSNVWAAVYTSAGSGNWNTPATWGTVDVPGINDDVVITAGHTVTFDPAATTITNVTVNGTLQPNIGNNTLTVRKDLTVGATGVVNYNNGVGRLNWVFNHDFDGAATIANSGSLNINNLTLSGAGTTTTAANFTIWGNTSIAGTADFNATAGTITLSNGNASTQNITGAGSLSYFNLTTSAGATVNVSKDFNINGTAFTVNNTGAFSVTGSNVMTIGNAVAGVLTFTDNGTFALSANSTLSITKGYTLASDLNNISGSVSFTSGVATHAGFAINGTGTYSAGAGTSFILNNNNGVLGALNLSGGVTLANNNNFTFNGGTTGFPANTTVNDVVIGGAVASTDSYTVNGNFTVNAASTYTAGDGTVTFGAGNLTNNGGAITALTFNNVHVATATRTVTAGGFVVGGSLTAVAGAIDFGTFTVRMTGTGNLGLLGNPTFGVGATIDVVGGNVTLSENINLAANGLLRLTSGTLDLGTATIAGTLQPKLELTAGTVRTANNAGFRGNFAAYGASELAIAAGINFEYYGGTTQTSLGLFLGAIATGAGTATINYVNNIGNLTIMNAAAIANIGTTATATVTVVGNLSVANTASMVLGFHATNDLFAITGPGTINVTSTAANPLQFNGLAVTGAVTTSSNFATIGVLSGGGSLTASAPSVITMRSGVGSMISPTLTTLSFYDVVVDGNLTGFAPSGSYTVQNNILFDNAGDYVPTAGTVTFTGANANLYISNDAGAISFTGLTVNAGSTLNLPIANATVTSLLGVNTATAISDLNIEDTGILTINGTLNTGAAQVTTFAGAGTLAGTGTGNFKTLTLGAAVASTLTTLNVETELDGAGTFNQTFGTLFPTGTLSVPTTISVNTFTPNALTVGASNRVNITVPGVGTNNPDYNINGYIHTTAAQAMGTTGVLNFNSGATVSTTVAGGIATTYTAGAGAKALNVDQNVDYIIGTAGAIGLGTGATFTNFTVNGTGSTNATEINIINNLTIAGAIAATTANSLTINGNLEVNNVGGTFAHGTAGTITFNGPTSQIITPADNAVSFFALGVGANGVLGQTGNFITPVTGTVAPTVTVAAGGNLNLTTGTISLTGAVANGIQNAGTMTFNNLEISDAYTAVNTSFTIGGNLTTTAVGLTATGGTVTFTGNPAVITTNADGDITFFNLAVAGAVTRTGAHIVNVAGTTTSAVSVTGSLTDTEGTFNFTGNEGGITNTGNLTFNNVTLAATPISSASDFTISGNLNVGANIFTHTGTLTLDAGGVANGVATITTGAASALNFTNLLVTGGPKTFAGAFISNIAGNLTIQAGGNIQHAVGTLNFTGATTKTISNNGTLVVENFTMEDIASNRVDVAGNMTISTAMTIPTLGRLNATSGTITFDAATLNVSQPTAANVQFADLAVTPGPGPFPAVSIVGGEGFNVSGDISVANDARFEFNLPGKRITLNGTAEQNYVGNGATADQFVVTNLTVANTNGLKLSHGTSNIADYQFTITENLRLTGGSLDLNGNNIVTIDNDNNPANANTALLIETAGNAVFNSGPATATGNVYFPTVPGAILTNNQLGRLGVTMTTAADPGATVIRRYHTLVEPGGQPSATRFYGITAANGSLNSTVRFRYDNTELGEITTTNGRLLNSANATNAGPWYGRATTGSTEDGYTTFVTTGVNNYAASNQYWAVGSANSITITQITPGTKGLAPDTLTAGRTNQAIQGLTLTASAQSSELNSIRFGLNRNLSATPELNTFKIYRSLDNSYATTDDNEEITGLTLAGGTAGANHVTFSGMTDELTFGAERTYFLVANVSTAANASTAVLQPQVANTDITVNANTGIVNVYSASGTEFRFRPGIMLTGNFNGVNESPLTGGQAGVAMFGFQTQATSNSSLTGFTLSTNLKPSDVFKTTAGSVKVYLSTDNSYTTTGDNLLLGTTATFNDNGIYIQFNAAQTVFTTARNYFVVFDLANTLNVSSDPLVLTLNHSDIVSSTGAPRFFDLAGNASTKIVSTPIEFKEAKVSLSVANQVPAGNVSRAINNQPLYRFTLTSDNGVNVSFTELHATVTFSSTTSATQFNNFRLWYDANGNGYPDAGEQISTGTYDATKENGNLRFASFTSNQTFNSNRKYIVTVNVPSTSTLNGTLRIDIKNHDYVKITSPAQLNVLGTQNGWNGNTKTVVQPGAATRLAIVGKSSSSVTTGGTINFAIQSQDASGNVSNVVGAENVTLAINALSFSAIGNNTGNILAGSNYLNIAATLTEANGTTTAAVIANGSSLTSSAVESGITILPAGATTQSTGVTVGTITSTTVQLTGWGVGNGDGRIVVIRKGLPPHAPTNGTTYTASTNVGEAALTSQTGPGSIVVYVAAAAPNFSISNLTPGQDYYIQVFEYIGTGALRVYNTAPNPDGNPLKVSTLAGDLAAGASADLPAYVSTDVELSGALTAANAEKWYSFIVNGEKNNVLVKVSSLPANYNIELYRIPTGGNANDRVLVRNSARTNTSSEYMILNAATAGRYLLRVVGADADQFSSSSFNFKVTTSASELLSQTE